MPLTPTLSPPAGRGSVPALNPSPRLREEGAERSEASEGPTAIGLLLQYSRVCTFRVSKQY
jgi:hypothetical protein